MQVRCEARISFQADGDSVYAVRQLFFSRGIPQQGSKPFFD